MAISYVGTASNNLDNGSSGSVDISGIGIQDGDLILFFGSCDGSGLALPSGFNSLQDVDTSGSHNNLLAYKVASSEGSSIAIATSSGSERAIAIVGVFRGVDQSDPIDSSNSNIGGSDSTAVISSLTPSTDNCAVAAFVGTEAGNAGNPITSGWPSSLNEFNDNVNGPPGSGSASSAGAGAYVIQTTAGAVSGNVSLSNGSTFWGAMAVSLNPTSSDTAPTVSLDTPADAGTATSTTPELGFTGTDSEDDDISYEIQIATDNTFSPGQAAPTLIGTSGNTWTSTSGSARTTSSLSWQTGDLIVVLGMHENNNHSIGTPSASGLSFSSVSGFPTNTGSSCKAYAWQATAGSNGSGTITATLSQSGDMGNIQAFVYRGSDGIGNTYAVATGSGTTNNLTRASDKSAVVWAGGDWGANNDTSVTGVPSGGTQRQAAYVSGAATMFCFDWDDQGSAGTTSYGISGFSTGSNFTKIALEIRGSTGSSSIIIDKLSDTDTGFVNKDDGGDTDPFTSGDQIGYTVQAGDALTDTNTYYWRVRGEDPSGTGTFGDWSSIYSFTVDTSAGGGDGSFFYLFSDML